MKYLKSTVTIGIPTYYGGDSLIRTVESIRGSVDAPPFRLIVCVDGNPLRPEVELRLTELGAEVIFSEVRGGQLERLKQIIGECDTEYLLFTQDDILFSRDTLREMVAAVQGDPDVTMVSGNGQFLPPRNFFEKIMHTGADITDTIGAMWNDGDNYLRVGGRCLAFRADFAKSMKITDSVMSSDVFFYFYNKKFGKRFRYVPEAVYFLRSPDNLSEHLRQSRKYQLVDEEIHRSVGIDVEKEYPIPFRVRLTALVKQFFRHPLLVPCYVAVFLYTRVFGKHLFDGKKFWDTDVSTKKL